MPRTVAKWHRQNIAMHTIKILLSGLVLLGIIWGLTRILDTRGIAWAGPVFSILWAIVCMVNSAIGMRAGYSFITELAAFGITFSPVAAVAWLVLANR